MTDLRQVLREEIARLEATAATLKETLAVLGSTDGSPRRRKKFRMSAEGRARIAAAQKKRWKAFKAKKTKKAA